MIPAVGQREFAALLRDRREQSYDESTGRSYTQDRMAVELEKRLGKSVGRTTYRSWETDTAPLLGPDEVNALADVLGNITVDEMVEAMGFRVRRLPLNDEERDLLAAYRRLRNAPILQAAALRSLQAMPPQPAPPRRGRRASQ